MFSDVCLVTPPDRLTLKLVISRKYQRHIFSLYFSTYHALFSRDNFRRISQTQLTTTITRRYERKKSRKGKYSLSLFVRLFISLTLFSLFYKTIFFRVFSSRQVQYLRSSASCKRILWGCCKDIGSRSAVAFGSIIRRDGSVGFRRISSNRDDVLDDGRCGCGVDGLLVVVVY